MHPSTLFFCFLTLTRRSNIFISYPSGSFSVIVTAVAPFEFDYSGLPEIEYDIARLHETGENIKKIETAKDLGMCITCDCIHYLTCHSVSLRSQRATRQNAYYARES